MKLSENFTLFEFTHSTKADALGLDNTPNAMQIANMQAWCDQIGEPIRKHYNAPVRITSGFRCPELNRAVGGASNSQHLFGQAADIHIDGVRNDDLWNFITNKDNGINYDQCIAERLSKDDGAKGWVHVSCAIKNRKDALSCPTPNNYVKGLVYGG